MGRLISRLISDETNVAGIGTVALLNRQADSAAGGFGAAAAEWAGPVKYCVASTEPMNSKKNSVQSFMTSMYFSRYSSQYSSEMISNMISP